MEVLKASNISVRFGSLQALNDISFSLKKGERRGLIGPNGAGKTTFFNVVSGYIKPTTGDIYLFGNKTTGIAPYKYVRKGLARTFQKSNVFLNLSVLENVLLSLDKKDLNSHAFRSRGQEMRERAENFTARFRLLEKRHWPAKALSHGEQRVLEIALALALEPELLLLDEPAAGLSTAEITTITDLIQSFPSSMSLIIIEHDMDLIFNISDKITVFHYGTVLTEGTVQEIKSHRKVREIYIGTKTGQSNAESQ